MKEKMIIQAVEETGISREEKQAIRASLADRACEILLELIAGKEAQKENIISVSLVERDSTR